ncbi:MAG: hypothetical protein OXI24_11250 [Candidatus Poribacteria bacterium]|nr:hypothetical protein [Candidatus Poribacteria bacterium]
MNHKQRLLILSCSQRKRIAQASLPAIERYNGPLFFVLRRFLRECPHQAEQLEVCILSAAYGLIPGDFPTALYDQKMDASRVVELQQQINITFRDILQNNYASICFVLGKAYMKGFESLLDLIPSSMETIITRGTIGRRQAQLKNWLWEKSLDN